MGEEKEKKGDARLEAIYQKVWGVFGFTKSKKNEKTLAAIDESTKGAITGFLNDQRTPFLFLFPGGDGQFTGSNELPTLVQLKKKAMVIHKTRPSQAVTEGNMSEQMITFEFTKNVSF